MFYQTKLVQTINSNEVSTCCYFFFTKILIDLINTKAEVITLTYSDYRGVPKTS